MVELILEPLTYSFILRGLAAGLLAAVACAVLSAFVVWRGMAFVGDALAHAILPGIVVAFVFGFSLFLGALGAGALAVVGIGALSGRGKLKEDTAKAAFEATRKAMGSSSVSVEEAVIRGDAGDAILEHAASVNNPMIIIGRRGLSQFRELLVGSTTQRVMHHAKCPVLVIR